MKSKIVRGIATVVTALLLPIGVYTVVTLVYNFYRWWAGMIDQSHQDYIAGFCVLVVGAALITGTMHHGIEQDIKSTEDKDEATNFRSARQINQQRYEG